MSIYNVNMYTANFMYRNDIFTRYKIRPLNLAIFLLENFPRTHCGKFSSDVNTTIVTFGRI